MMKTSVFIVSLFVVAAKAARNSSCKDILDNSVTRPPSGIYTLEDSRGFQYQTYCDMLTNMGGWTLIASVHENNAQDNGRCTRGDRWSSEQGASSLQPRAENWMNQNTFGNVISATADDFKSPGYFDIKAKNLMIWQVPNDTPLEDWRPASYMRYRTESDFFDYFNGNLFQMYKYFFPIVSNQYSWPADNGPQIPVVFDEGNGGDLVSHFGPSVQQDLTPGYIQFRALNTYLDAFAICPGVKLSESSAYGAPHACFGSTGDNAGTKYCGDFAGWTYSGYGTHTDWSVDKYLIETTFLLFYR